MATTAEQTGIREIGQRERFRLMVEAAVFLGGAIAERAAQAGRRVSLMLYFKPSTAQRDGRLILLPTKQTPPAGFQLVTDEGLPDDVPEELHFAWVQSRCRTLRAHVIAPDIPHDLPHTHRRLPTTKEKNDMKTLLGGREFTVNKRDDGYFYWNSVTRQWLRVAEANVIFPAIVDISKITDTMLQAASVTIDSDEALKALQDAAGIDSGENASMFFSERDLRADWPLMVPADRLAMLRKYVEFEAMFAGD